MRNVLLQVIIIAQCLALAGCAAQPPDPEAQNEDRLENYNRSVHGFNGGLHRKVVHPVGKAVDFVIPDIVENGFEAFFDNLSVPNTAINNLAQGKAKSAGQDFMRFSINTTIGLLGFIDWASRWGIPKHDEDLGQTLAHYGVSPGPYISIPVLGGTTPRDIAAGLISIDPRYLIGLDGLVVARAAQSALRLSKKSQQEELPSYDEERERYYINEHCNTMDESYDEEDDYTLNCKKGKNDED
jgi:ABC-type transporter lipoprotein component MlaA